MGGALIALLSALLWAMASVLLALSAKSLHVLPLNLVRSVVSTSFFWVLLPFTGGVQALIAIPSRAWVWLVVSVLGLLVVGDTLYFRSLDLAGVSWAMPVASINTLWAVLLAALFLHEPLTGSLASGTVLVLLGITLVSRSSRQSHLEDADRHKTRRAGLLFAVAASVMWGVGQVALKPATTGLDAVVANSVRQPMALLMLLGLNLSSGRWRDLRGLSRRTWLIIFLASFVGTGLGALLFVMAIQQAGAGRTAVLTATAPMMAIPFSMLWLRERPTRWTIAGTLLTTAGIALVA